MNHEAKLQGIRFVLMIKPYYNCGFSWIVEDLEGAKIFQQIKHSILEKKITFFSNFSKAFKLLFIDNFNEQFACNFQFFIRIYNFMIIKKYFLC